MYVMGVLTVGVLRIESLFKAKDRIKDPECRADARFPHFGSFIRSFIIDNQNELYHKTLFFW